MTNSNVCSECGRTFYTSWVVRDLCWDCASGSRDGRCGCGDCKQMRKK